MGDELEALLQTLNNQTLIDFKESHKYVITVNILNILAQFAQIIYPQDIV